MKLVVGLGNPGKRYQKTRHNVGFVILDQLHHDLGVFSISLWKLSKKFNAEIAGCTISAEKIILVKPMTFMNTSGEAVQLIAHYYKIPPQDIIVVHDDKDIQLGEVKMQENRGHGGHNGIRSIIDHVKTKEFFRIRVGIAPKNNKKLDYTAKFVLGKFSLFEKGTINKAIKESVEYIKKFINAT